MYLTSLSLPLILFLGVTTLAAPLGPEEVAAELPDSIQNTFYCYKLKLSSGPSDLHQLFLLSLQNGQRLLDLFQTHSSTPHALDIFRGDAGKGIYCAMDVQAPESIASRYVLMRECRLNRIIYSLLHPFFPIVFQTI